MKESQLRVKLGSDMEALVRSALDLKLRKAAESAKQAIIDKYDEELVDVVTDRDSKTNPNFYRDDFIDRLNKFEFLTIEDGNPTIVLPDMENFDFSGRLSVIEMIMEGTAGLYVEVNQEQYVSIFKTLPTNQNPIDQTVAPAERTYLVRYSSRVRAAEKANGKRFIPFYFSNTPPINIFVVGDEFVEKNIDTWINDAKEMATKAFANNFKGARL